MICTNTPIQVPLINLSHEAHERIAARKKQEEDREREMVGLTANVIKGLVAVKDLSENERSCVAVVLFGFGYSFSSIEELLIS